MGRCSRFFVGRRVICENVIKVSVAGRAGPGEMKVSRFRRTAFGRWSAKRPRWKDWSLTAVCLNEMTHEPGGYTRWEMQFLFGSLHWLQSTRESLCPPSFFHRVNPPSPLPLSLSPNEIYHRRLSSRYIHRLSRGSSKKANQRMKIEISFP